MKKLQKRWMNRVFREVYQDLNRVHDRYQKGKPVDLSRWGTIENLEWILQLMKNFIQK